VRAAVTIYAVSVVLTLPFAWVLDRRARYAGVPRRRRFAVLALALVASPLGGGLWLGLVHRERRS
jgi:hypothetical protein